MHKHTLTIPSQFIDAFKHLVSSLDPKAIDDYCISVIIDAEKKSILFVGGVSPNYTQLTIPMNDSPPLRSCQFAFPGEFCRLAITVLELKETEPTLQRYAPILLNLTLSKGKYTQVQQTPTFLPNHPDEKQSDYPAFRRFALSAVQEAHTSYVNNNDNKAFHPISKTMLQHMIQEANGHLPFDYIEMNSETSELKIQRNGQLQHTALAKHIKPPISTVINPQALDNIKMISECDSNNIEINLEGEVLTIRNDEQTISQSLGDVAAFYELAPPQKSTLLVGFIDFFYFKKELTDHKKYPSLKKENLCHLLIDEGEMFMLSICKGHEFAQQIPVQHLKQTYQGLFTFHPKDLERTTLKGLAEAHEMKVAISQFENGEYDLEFFSEHQQDLPYTSIPLTNKQDDIEQYLKLKATCLSQKTVTIEVPETQLGLFLHIED
ncbi:hypothetical protein [Parashewanella tropica]|uniref:hypothetical protein n=1 Tax=Parashewanella tropica TaxID=2547970 RepID=UPI0010594186|nr:hypothetical protein [Parashewanella tropica]